MLMVTAPVAPLTEIPVPATLEVTPVLVMTPVAEAYEIPVPPESEVLEILLLKRVKSADERYPLVESVAWVMESAPALKVSGAVTVVDCTCPCALVERSALVSAVTAKLVVDAVPMTVSPPLTVDEA